MIIIDTNVISEVIRPGRNPKVLNWLDEQIIETLYLTATSLSELRLGIECLPAGKRKKALNADIHALLSSFFDTRILPFDREAALAYGTLLASASIKGKSVSVSDGQIAAIASIYNFYVATRDTAPFAALGVPVIDPWKL